MTETDMEALWARYLATRSDDERNALAEHYLPLVRPLAAKLKARLPANVELEDLVSYGTLGLLDAITRYEPKRGFKFETFCQARVRGAMLDELRNQDWVPRLVRSRGATLKSKREELSQKLGREPTVAELAKGLGKKVREVEQLEQEVRPVERISLSKKFFETDSFKDVTTLSMLTDRHAEDPAGREVGKDILRLISKNLNRESRLVVILYYFEGLTMKEIGRQLGLSESRISQMHSQIMNELRRRLESRRGEIAA